jgi:hypothetical protein
MNTPLLAVVDEPLNELAPTPTPNKPAGCPGTNEKMEPPLTVKLAPPDVSPNMIPYSEFVTTSPLKVTPAWAGEPAAHSVPQINPNNKFRLIFLQKAANHSIMAARAGF